MRRTVLTAALLAIATLQIFAQQETISLQAEARIDYQREYIDDNAIHPNSGFKGKYLNIIATGNITDNISYAYRQRLNKAHQDQSFFDATDWAYITYKADEHWNLSAGKQVVGIGGYEYDRAPIDLYACSEYWNNIPCYELGVSATYSLTNNDQIVAQYCESPFRRTGNNHNDMYAYNIMWYGSHGWFNTIYSLNMIEYMPGKYISYIALGNKLNAGDFSLELDFMNRATSHQTYLLRDCSIMGELSWKPSDKLKVWGKVTYDVNKTSSPGDYCVMPGTELTSYSLGLEYYPLKGSKDIRLHALANHTTGTNGNPDGTLTDKRQIFDIGLKWHFNLLTFKK